MRATAILVAAALSGCAGRMQSNNPYLPPEAHYSTAGTVAAGVGVMAAAVGSDAAQDSRRSPRTRAAGSAAVAAGIGLMGLALIDAIEVQKEREQLLKIYRALQNQALRPAPSDGLRPLPPPLPEIPFTFPDVEEAPRPEETP